ncbi:MAG: hypothetical protein QM784_22810 [Polyangiaceae bacterium]
MFKISFDGLQLASGDPLSCMSVDRFTSRNVLADVHMLVAGEITPTVTNGEGKAPFNVWCQAVDGLPINLLLEDGSRYKVTDQWGRLKEVLFRRKGDEVTVSFPGEKRKFRCTYEELRRGVQEFKGEVRERLLASASRDVVALWWKEVFIETLP